MRIMFVVLLLSAGVGHAFQHQGKVEPISKGASQPSSVKHSDKPDPKENHRKAYQKLRDLIEELGLKDKVSVKTSENGLGLYVGEQMLDQVTKQKIEQGNLDAIADEVLMGFIQGRLVEPTVKATNLVKRFADYQKIVKQVLGDGFSIVVSGSSRGLTYMDNFSFVKDGKAVKPAFTLSPQMLGLEDPRFTVQTFRQALEQSKDFLLSDS